MQLAGSTLGGMLMARSALIAAARLAAGAGDASFYQTKIHTARFYAEHLLPLASAAAHTVMSGAGATLALDESDF